MIDTLYEKMSKELYGYLSPWRRRKLKRDYDLNTETLLAILYRQQGNCAICEKTINLKEPRAWLIDYSEECQFVRGILCRYCKSVLLPLAIDDTDVTKAKKYVTESRCD